MEFLSGMGGNAAGFFGAVIPFLFVLTIVVFVHEMGHFLVGRWCGVGVHAFSIGFGPELIGFNDRRGTRWKLSARWAATSSSSATPTAPACPTPRRLPA